MQLFRSFRVRNISGSNQLCTQNDKEESEYMLSVDLTFFSSLVHQAMFCLSVRQIMPTHVYVAIYPATYQVCRRSANQSISLSANQSGRQSVIQSVSQSANQSFRQSVNQSVRQSDHQSNRQSVNKVYQGGSKQERQSVSPFQSGLTLKTSALKNSSQWQIRIINSIDKTKLSCYPPPSQTQRYSSCRNLPPLFISQSVCVSLSVFAGQSFIQAVSH